MNLTVVYHRIGGVATANRGICPKRGFFSYFPLRPVDNSRKICYSMKKQKREVRGVKRTALAAVVAGAAVNFLLFLVKLYVGVATNSLSVYCDAVNNLGDTFACGVAVLGFALSRRLDARRAGREQSLATFVISIVIAVTGFYFVYNGLERLLYPLPISYSAGYAAVIAATIAVKLLLALLFHRAGKASPSPVLRALVLDSMLDCFITLFALMGLFLIVRVRFAADGVFAILCGAAVTVSAVRAVSAEARYLINE